MKIGTQASDGIDRSAWIEGSNSRCSRLLAPFSIPKIVPSAPPMANPMSTRVNVARVCDCSSPLRSRADAVSTSREGGGISRPEARPRRTVASHPAASSSGMIQPTRRDARVKPSCPDRAGARRVDHASGDGGHIDRGIEHTGRLQGFAGLDDRRCLGVVADL